MVDGLTRRDFGRLAVLGAGGAALLGMRRPALAAAKAFNVSGPVGAGLAGFDSTMRTFMQERDISCGSLAVTRAGRLLLARGYTWSDDTSLSTQPTSLFRLASLSKMFTAAAILKLAQDGLLDLGTPVTDLLTLVPPPGKTMDARLKNITVWRLLQHTGGWDRDISGDVTAADRTIASALGVPLPITNQQTLVYTTGLALDHAPGSTYAYSNYGYLLLGLIIEKVTRMHYRDYVQQEILTPLGINRMGLGRTLARASREVPYVSTYTGKTVMDDSGTVVPAPYGTFNVENKSSYGRWLGTTVDMVRFAGLFDAPSSILSNLSLTRAFAEPEVGIGADGSYYGCGWHVRPVAGGRNTWHTGSLPGTFTIVVRRSDGVTFAALFNQRDDPSSLSYGAIDSLLNRAANSITTWPNTDLYPNYF